MGPLRLLHVTPYYEDAWAYGGIPRVVSALARGLAGRGHHVTVCTTDVCDQASRASRLTCHSAGVEVWTFPNLSNRLAYRLQLYTPRGLGPFLRRRAAGFDLAHLHGCHHLPGSIAARELRRAGVPYLLSPNGTAPRIERRRVAKWLFDHTLGRRVVPGATRVLAVSAAERRQLAALGAADGVLRLLPNPLDLGELEPAPRRGAWRGRWELGEGPVVLYLGMLTPRKGISALVAAFARARLPGARLVIAGNDRGVMAGLRGQVRDAELTGRVIFTGLLRGRERLQALADADLVAYPGRDEAFGLVPLEALLCGTPVVVADDHGCGEVIAEVGGGLRVPPGDPAALAAALAAVLAAPATWRAAARAAAARVRQRFAAEVVCRRLEELYAEVRAEVAARAA